MPDVRTIYKDVDYETNFGSSCLYYSGNSVHLGTFGPIITYISATISSGTPPTGMSPYVCPGGTSQLYMVGTPTVNGVYTFQIDALMSDASHQLVDCVHTVAFGPAPTITSIVPASGPILGGTAVTITGTNFSAAMTLFITDTKGQSLNLVDRVDVSSTSITGKMPAHAAGLVSLAAKNIYGSDTLSDCYTYINQFTAGENIFTYAPLRTDPELGVSEQAGGEAQLTYGVLGTGTPARPPGLASVSMIDPNTGDVLGRGLNLQIDQTWMDGPKSPANPLPSVRWKVVAGDRRWLLNRKTVTGVWINIPAAQVVREVLDQFAPAFSSDGVQTDLASISISSKREKKVADFLDDVCSLLGGASWYIDPATDTVYLGFSLQSGLAPAIINDSNMDLLRESPIEYSEDWSQIRNRIHVRGMAVRRHEGEFEQQPNFNGPTNFLYQWLSGPGQGNIDLVNHGWILDYLLAYVLDPTPPQPLTSTLTGVETVVQIAGLNEFSIGEAVTLAGVVGSVPDINGTHTVVNVSSHSVTVDFTTTVVGTGGTIVTNEADAGLAIGPAIGWIVTSYVPSINNIPFPPGLPSSTGNAIRLTNIQSSQNPRVKGVRIFRAKQVNPNYDPANLVYGKNYYTVGDITEGAYDPSASSFLTFLDTKADSELGAVLNADPGAHPFNTAVNYEIWASVDDTASQALVAARLGGDDDGVVEAVIDDSSLTTMADLIARGQAEIDLFAQPIKTVKYATRDRKSRRGRDATIHLSNPPIDDGAGGPLILKIQDVKIDQIHENGVTVPRFNVTASSVRFTLGDLLKRAQLTMSSALTGSSGTPSSLLNNPGYFGAPTTNLWTLGEVPSGAVNGVNTTFRTVRRFIPNSLQWFVRGLAQQPLVDFMEIDGGFEATVAPTAFLASGHHWVNYRG